MQVAAGAAFHTTSATDGRHDTVSRALLRTSSKLFGKLSVSKFMSFHLFSQGEQHAGRGGRCSLFLAMQCF